jgi:hypothetical protein
MKAALHGDDRRTGKLAAEQATLVADGGRLEEVRYVAVVDRGVEFDRVAHGTEARAEDDAHSRLRLPSRADEFGRLGDLINEMVHSLWDHKFLDRI